MRSPCLQIEKAHTEQQRLSASQNIVFITRKTKAISKFQAEKRHSHYLRFYEDASCCWLGAGQREENRGKKRLHLSRKETVTYSKEKERKKERKKPAGKRKKSIFMLLEVFKQWLDNLVGNCTPYSGTGQEPGPTGSTKISVIPCQAGQRFCSKLGRHRSGHIFSMLLDDIIDVPSCDYS